MVLKLKLFALEGENFFSFTSYDIRIFEEVCLTYGILLIYGNSDLF
jgi:hypothetical protein